mgnify:CR=1 FL=1|tara:strand:+ start:2725 stop:3483 length:759 start_codon:yes stop_codon:yes gene_type:complete
MKKNRIDILIDSLSAEFAKIPNFEMTQTDSDANKLFNFILTKFSDINDFKTLYKRYYIPATNKAIVEAKNEIRSSYYRKILDVSDEQLKENYYDTIRLGYVGLFHKVENYVKDLLIHVNMIFNEGKTGANSIEKFFEKKYEFKFTNWHSNIHLNKINWICNCVKHYDGYPKKEPKYRYLSHLPEEEKIKIHHNDFFKDIEYVAEVYYQIKLTQILSLSLFKIATDNLSESDLSDDLSHSYKILEDKIKLLMT